MLCSRRGKNAIKLLSLNLVVHKHTICSGHATDVSSFSKEDTNNRAWPHDAFESFALLTLCGESAREPSRHIHRMFAVGLPAHIRHLAVLLSVLAQGFANGQIMTRQRRLQQYLTRLGSVSASD